VQAWNTVAVRSQIDGKLTTVNFVEGQEVRQGEILAQIDTSALKATLDEAIAKKEQDEAQLAAVQKDLERYRMLIPRQIVPQQQTVDQQQAKVDQLRATVNADRAAIDSARVQLGYATITAPIDGRIGLRQLDVGNIIHVNDTNPLTILTLPQRSVQELLAEPRAQGNILGAQGHVDFVHTDGASAMVAQEHLCLLLLFRRPHPHATP
jgi:multidrug efflux system membrane fusion protein